MRSVILFYFFIVLSLSAAAQSPVLAVNRVDKRTKEVIKQTSLYPFKDGGSVTKLYFCVRSTDANYFLQFNVNQPVTVKKGTEITVSIAGGQPVSLRSDNDIISLSESDISKRMIVCALTPAELKMLMTHDVASIRIPTANKGTLDLNLIAKDRSAIKAGLFLLEPDL